MANLQSWSEPIPDVVGTILAARAWCYFDGRLFPVYSGATSRWLPATFGMWYKVEPEERAGKAWGDSGVQTASCPLPSERHMDGQGVPSRQCICGFWGLLEPKYLATALGLKSPMEGGSSKLLDEPKQGWQRPFTRAPTFVLGTVRMWGRVIPGEAGWRSSKAQIDGILATSHPQARKIARRYGVPILAAWPELTPAMEKSA